MDLKEQGRGGSRHPWERARVRALKRILGRFDLPPKPTVLDLGTGDGYALNALFGGGTGLDPHFTDEDLARLRERYPGSRWIRDFDRVGDETFDVVLTLDVLEHVPDDVGLIRGSVSRLKPGGVWVATVPAFQALFTAHDTFLKHHRRYSRRELVRVLSEGGLRVEASGYLFGSLLGPRAVQRGLEAIRGPGSTAGIGAWHGGRLASGLIELALNADSRVLLGLQRRGLTLPGLSVWAVCRRS